MSSITRMGHALYTGRMSIDFVGRWKLWYSFSLIIVLLASYGLVFKGLNLGIEFQGGVEYKVSLPISQVDQQSVTTIRNAVASSGISAAKSPIVNTSGSQFIRVQVEPLTTDETGQLSTIIETAAGVGVNDVSVSAIGPSWGQQVANKALLGLIVFLILVVIFIWAYFREWKMSAAAILALAHDLTITVGVYALSGFEVSPATVTGVLTILGFSLYDTVVVFDKVRENTKHLSRIKQTYGEAANLAVNQTLVRSINTSIVALLPVGALLYVGVFTLGSGALKDLSLALFVGMAAGTYSSIFIATPFLVQLKELEPGVKTGNARVRKARKKAADVDPYKEVPSFAEGMPIYDDPGAEPSRPAVPPPVTAPPPPRTTAGTRPASKEVSQSPSAGRPQPRRKPRSQR